MYIITTCLLFVDHTMIRFIRLLTDTIMPKSRKKKVKHQDFAKVKLKVGKKLPRAANETNSSFQSRSIQLKEQFKGTESNAQPTTKRKLAITDLLAHCQHYSTNVKHDALVGLRELLQTERRLIQQNLNTLLSRCAELFVDKDGVVRSAIHRLFRIILPSVSANEISPFFPILSAHLCCAMTHIYEDIQADSLVILDLLLDHYPELVIGTTSQLLPNFLEQISRNSGSSKNGKNSRTLLVNPSGKAGSQKWRVGVLERLKKLLQAIVSVKSQSSTGGRHEEGVHEECWGDSKGYQPLAQTAKGQAFTLRPLTQIRADGSDSLTDTRTLQSYMKTIVPLLLECWVEVGPTQLPTSQTGNTLNSDALSTLANIVDVLILMLKYTESCADDNTDNNMVWSTEDYRKEFIKYFMVHFPYDVHHRPQKKTKTVKPENQTITVQTLNLAVCQLMTYFMDQSQPSLQKESWFQTVTDYITGQLRECKQSTEQLETSLSVVQKVLNMKPDEDCVESILDAVYHLYRVKHPLSADLRALLQFFADNFLDRTANFSSSTVSSKWMESLLKILKPVSSQHLTLTLVLKVMKSAAVQRNEYFLQKLEISLHEIIDPEFMSKLNKNHQKMVAEILYNIPKWTQKHLQLVSTLLLSDTLPVDIQTYLLGTLTQRMQRCRTNGTVDPSDFISFLFTVTFGQTRDQLTPMSASSEVQTDGIFCITLDENSNELLQNQLQRVECVQEQLSLLMEDEQHQQMCKLWRQFVRQVLNDNRKISVQSAVSILKMTSSFQSSCESATEFNSLLGPLIFDTMAAINIAIATITDHVTTLGDTVHKHCQNCLQKSPDIWQSYLEILKGKIVQGTDPGHILQYLRQSLGSNPHLDPSVVQAISATLDTIAAKDATLVNSQPYATVLYILSLQANR